MIPDRGPTAYVSCAEPSWAAAVPERQLRGLLTLTALLSERVFLSDVHLGDNANFLNSYKADSQFGLYRHLRTLAEDGIVSLLLRTASVRPHAAIPQFPCESFADVYRSWRAQDPDSAWIIPPDDDARLTFLSSIDKWAGNSIVRYDYAAVKRTFMTTAQKAASAGVPAHYAGDLFTAIPGSMADYERVLGREWFTLSDFYEFFQSRGVPASHPIMLVHGLMNEVAYSTSTGTSLVGADLYGQPLEEAFWPTPHRTDVPVRARAAIGALLDRATQVLDVPALSVLGLLSADEIAALREGSGRGYFEMLHLISDPAYFSASAQGTAMFSRALADYWTAIADHLSRQHPQATHAPRKLAILLDTAPGPLRRAAAGAFSFALNIGIPAAAAAGVLPAPLAAAGKSLAQAAAAAIRLVFLAETPELTRIRELIPDGTWLTKSSPVIFPASGSATAIQ